VRTWTPHALGACLLLAGCSHGDPLGDQRQDFQTARLEVVEEGWRPAAVVAVDVEALEEAVLLAVGTPAPSVLAGPLGMPVTIQPKLNDIDLVLSPGDTEGAIHVVGTAEATAKITVPPFIQRTASGTIIIDAVVLTRFELGAFHAKWAGPVGVDIALADTPDQVAAVIEGFASTMVEEQVTRQLEEERSFRLPAGSPLQVRAARVRVDEALYVELALLASGDIEPPVDPTPAPGGWAVTVSDASLTAVLAGLALQLVPEGRFGFEPVGLALEDTGAFSLDLRWHRASGRPSWRDLRLHGTVDLSDTSLGLDRGHLEFLGAEHWAGTPPLAIIERRIDKAVPDLGVDWSGWTLPVVPAAASIGHANGDVKLSGGWLSTR
jgi:hypothetical protein